MFVSLLHIVCVLCLQKTGCCCFVCGLSSTRGCLVFQRHTRLLKHAQTKAAASQIALLFQSQRTLFIHYLFSGCAIVARALWWEVICHSLALLSPQPFLQGGGCIHPICTGGKQKYQSPSSATLHTLRILPKIFTGQPLHKLTCVPLFIPRLLLVHPCSYTSSPRTPD